MPKDELTRPLGLSPAAKPRRGLRWSVAAAVVVALGAAASGAWWLSRAPTSPTVTAAITQGKAPDASLVTGTVSAKPAPTAPAPQPSAGPGLTEVKPTGSLSEVGKVVIYDPSTPPPLALPATPTASVTETGNYGPLPKVADNGLRPLDAYARPPQDQGGARIAIIVGGIGVDAASSHDAIASLPGQVTLALAPFATDLPHTLADARAAGHELLLQLPLEPFGYPQTNPGPHTLTVAASPKANLDDLTWLLSRTTNYVGVVNYMGARFTTETQPMTDLMTAIGKRGLLYLDDGSSPRSLAADIAQGRAPFLKADLVIDPDLSPAAIDARLDQLVAIARQRGYAIGTASAFSASIDRIAAFAKAAKAKDITLVPVSSLVSAAKRT